MPEVKQKKNTKFNKDGSVEVTEKDGNVNRLSKEQYEGYLSQSGSKSVRGGIVDENVRALVDRETAQRQKEAVQAQEVQNIKDEAARAEVTQGTPQDTAQNTQTEQINSSVSENRFVNTQQAQTAQNQQTQVVQQQINPFQEKQKEQIAQFETFGLIDEERGQRLKKITSSLNPLSNLAISREVLDLTIDLADNFKAITNIGGKDTQGVKNARENINFAKETIANQIELARTGQADNAKLTQAITEYKRNIKFLQQTTKRKGLDNLAYWTTDGRNLEQELVLIEDDFNQLDADYQTALVDYKTLQRRNAIALS